MRRIFQIYGPFYRRHRWLLLGYLLLTVAHKSLAYLSPQTIQRLIDVCAAGDAAGFRTAVLLALALGVAFVPVLFFRYVVQYAAQNRADTLEREQILQDLLRLSLIDLKKKNLGHYVQLVSRDVEKAGGLAFYDGISFVGNLALAACMLGYMLKTDWLLSLLIVVTYPLFALATKRMVPRVERAEEAVIEAEEKLNTLTDELYTGGEEIRSTGAQAFFSERAKAGLSGLFRATERHNWLDNCYDLLCVNGLMNIANTLTFCIGGLRVLQGVISIGTVTLFALYFSSMWGSLEGVMEFFKAYRVKRVSLGRLAAFHEQPAEARAQAQGALDVFESLEVRDLRFAYGSRPVFEGFSMDLRRGERLLVTGENGSGKSTLGRLLVKLLIPSGGRIAYNGQIYADLDAQRLRARVLLVPAEPFLIEGAAEENLWDRPAAAARLPEALRGASVGQDGEGLSSGQKKQLQLARCLATDADVYILDEPFNYVDAAAKEDLWRYILEAFRDKTLVIISHDLFFEKDCTRRIRIDRAQS